MNERTMGKRVADAQQTIAEFEHPCRGDAVVSSVAFPSKDSADVLVVTTADGCVYSVLIGFPTAAWKEHTPIPRTLAAEYLAAKALLEAE